MVNENEDIPKKAEGIDFENERRRLYAQQILYRAIKYVIGYLVDYKIEKDQCFDENPMWIFIKVWWDKKTAIKEIKKEEEKIKAIVHELDMKRLKEAEKFDWKLEEEE